MKIMYSQSKRKAVWLTRALLLAAWVLCCQFSTAQITVEGTVSWPDGTPFDLPAGLTMTLRSTHGQILGTYSFPVSNGVINAEGLTWVNPLLMGSVEFAMAASVEPRARVTVLDLLRAQKHILGILPFTHALDVYAADVSASGSVSVLDLVEMRKMVLGIINEWPGKQSITFFLRTDTDPPVIGSMLNERLTFPDVQNLPPIISVDFWAVKTGDVHY